MNESKIAQLQIKLIKSYQDRMTFNFNGTEDHFCSYIDSGIISIPCKQFLHPTEWSLFAILHEIGHILTNTLKMKRCEQEFLATQWAIEEAKRIGFKVSVKYLDYYQEYIYNWRLNGIKKGGKNMPTKEQITLTY